MYKANRRILVGAASLLLLFTCILMVEPGKLVSSASQLSLWGLIGLLALLIVNTILTAFRFWRMLAHFNIRLPWDVISRATILGHAAALFTPSLMGQVVGRQVILRNFGMRPVEISGLVAYERIVMTLIGGALCALGSIALFGNGFSIDHYAGLSLLNVAVIFILVAGLSIWTGKAKFELVLIDKLASIANMLRIFEVIGITLVTQFLMISCYVLLMLILGHNATIYSLYAAAAILTFVAALPISVNGWGIREITAIFVLGRLGYSTADALLISITIGIVATMSIVLATSFTFLRKEPSIVGIDLSHAKTHSLLIGKITAWFIGIVTAIAVFIQVHVDLFDGQINVNLGDPFAILAFSTVCLQVILDKKLPVWKVGLFNILLLGFGILFLEGFIHGWWVIGVTQWALAGRLLGWFVLLGYVFAGYLIVTHIGVHGKRRFFETIVASAIVIILFQLTIKFFGDSYNLQGYAANRNAFAFQLLLAMAVLLGYFGRCPRFLAGSTPLLVILMALLLVGLVESGSRAGMLIGAGMLVSCSLFRIIRLNLLIKGILLGGGLIVLTYGVENYSHDFASAIGALGREQSNEKHLDLTKRVVGDVTSAIGVSGREQSNEEHWVLTQRAVEMWKEAPLWGVGLGVFIEESKTWHGYAQVIHNTPLWMLTELGLVGLLIFGWWWWVLVRHANDTHKYSRTGRTLLLVMVAFFFCLAHEVFYQRIFWLIIGALLAIPSVEIGLKPLKFFESNPPNEKKLPA